MQEITLLVEFAVKDGRLDGYRSASARMRDAVQRAEPGTTRYDWWLSDDGKRGFNIETFADSAALAVHMANTAPLVADLVAAADVIRVEVLGALTDEGHAAIDEAATGYFGPLGGIER
jgi:quinol monooxygenase YgiN